MIQTNYKMVDDCIVLLAYVSKHRNEPQSIPILSDRCGIPQGTLYHMLTDCQDILRHTAEKYGYDIWVAKSFTATCQFDRSKLIDAIKSNVRY